MKNIYIKKNNLYFSKDFKFYASKKNAMRFPNFEEAKRIMKSNIPFGMRNLCRIVTEYSKSTSVAKNIKSSFVDTSDNRTQKIAVDILSAVEKKIKIASELSDINAFLNAGKENLEKRHDYVSSKLSILDKEITDIIHYIEFSDFSERDGFSAYKLLHEKTNERRIVKNEKYDIEFVLDVINGVKDFEACKTHFNNNESPIYIPRALPELFKKAI